MAKVVIEIEPYDESSDPEDDTGLTSEAYEALIKALPGDIIDIKGYDD